MASLVTCQAAGNLQVKYAGGAYVVTRGGSSPPSCTLKNTSTFRVDLDYLSLPIIN